MKRMPNLDYEKLSPAQQQVHDTILSGPRGIVEGPLRVWLESAELAGHAQALGAFCRYNTILPQRLSELAIITTGAFWKAGFEWHVHAPIALESGLSSDTVDAIKKGVTPAFIREDEQLVYDFTSELLNSRAIGDATFERARTLLGYRGVVDLVGLLGYYGLISMTIKAFRVPVPDDAQEPFAQDEF